jgi:hypothetical protein
VSICVLPKYNWHKKVFFGSRLPLIYPLKKIQSLSSFGLDVQKNVTMMVSLSITARQSTFSRYIFGKFCFTDLGKLNLPMVV